MNLKLPFTRSRPCLWKGLVAGTLGGLAASWVMNQFQAALSQFGQSSAKPHGAQAAQPGEPNHGVSTQLQHAGAEEAGDNATERAASALAQTFLHEPLTQRQKETGGAWLHYAMGATSGGLYGSAAEFAPQVLSGAGAPFGAAVWLIADEAIVPALGLSKGPTEYPLNVHASALASHLVYGLTTEAVRRAVRRAL